LKKEILFMLIIGIALALLAILGIVFVFLPNGWNLIPLFLMGLVITLLLARVRTCCSLPREKSEEPHPDEPVTGKADETELTPKQDSPATKQRLNRAFGPIVAGMIIDLVDFATFGPLGLILGLPIGGLAGYWMGKALGLSRKATLWCALAAGIYCTIPGTEFIPLATMVGAYVQFQESGKNRRRKMPRRNTGRKTAQKSEADNGNPS